MEKEDVSKLLKLVLVLLLFLLLVNFLSNSEITGKATTSTDCNFFCRLLEAARIGPAPDAVVAPAYNLYYSLSSSRSSPQLLSGATLTPNTNVYVFIPSESGIRRVSFYLNGAFRRNEYGAPWDFAGTASGGVLALPWNTGSAASHQISASVRASSTVAVSANFKVGTVSCTNDCTTSGSKQCSGTGYQTCGNYDADSCLEWSTVTSCSIGQTCSAGTCVTTQYPLSVSKSGFGTGVVTSSPSGINCGSTCTSNFNSGTIVTLTATPDLGSVFLGWSGICSGVSTCTVTIDSSKSVNANFDLGGGVGLPPNVIISSPSNSTVFTTSTITVSGTATDDTSLSRVEVKVNNILQKTVTISGTSASWSTTVTLASGSNIIQAQAFDSNNLGSTTKSVTVTYNACTNDCSTSGARQCSGTGYQTCGNYDADSCLEWSTVTSCSIGQTCSAGTCVSSSSTLNAYTGGSTPSSGWSDTSWNSVNTYGNTEQSYDGSSVLKTVMGNWGGLQYSYSSTVNAGAYNNLIFNVYSSVSTPIAVSLKDNANTLPDLNVQRTLAPGWNTVTYTMTELNPSKVNFNYFWIQNAVAGSRTFYFDNVRFEGTGGVDTVPPTLSVSHSPNNPTTSQSVTLSVTASDSSGISEIKIYIDQTPLDGINNYVNIATCLNTLTCGSTSLYAAGTYSYYATAKDAFENSATNPSSGTKTFTVSSPICTPGTIQSGTTCNVCNAAGTGYSPDDTKCTSGQTCNSLGQCVTPSSNIWVTAYVNSWDIDMSATSGAMPYNAIDRSAATHFIAFAVCTDGSGNVQYNSLSAGKRKPFNDYIHAGGKPIMMSVGGWCDNLCVSINDATARTNLINSLVNAMRTDAYDGLDIDVEGCSVDSVAYSDFITRLRAAMDAGGATPASPRPILTAPIFSSMISRVAPVAQHFDQINYMSYDLIGDWWGETWHNNAAKNVPGTRTDSQGGKCDTVDWSEDNGNCMNTIQKMVQRTINSGIPKNKIGGGISFNGYAYVDGAKVGGGYPITPRDEWATNPSQRTISSTCGISAFSRESYYRDIKKCYIDAQPSSVKWDSLSQAPYISTGNTYITYNNEQGVRNGIKVIKEMGVGGVILWELGGAYLGKSQFPTVSGPRDPLLQAVKAEVNSP